MIASTPGAAINIPVGLPDLAGIGQIEPDAAGIGFVDDVGGDDLQRDGVADGMGHPGRLILGAGHETAGGRDPHLLQELLALMLHQIGPVLPAGLLQDLAEFRNGDPPKRQVGSNRHCRQPLRIIREGHSHREAHLPETRFQARFFDSHDDVPPLVVQPHGRPGLKAKWSSQPGGETNTATVWNISAGS
jgi:hypothetical protein